MARLSRAGRRFQPEGGRTAHFPCVILSAVKPVLSMTIKPADKQRLAEPACLVIPISVWSSGISTGTQTRVKEPLPSCEA